MAEQCSPEESATRARAALAELDAHCRAVAQACPDPARRSEFQGFLDGAVRQFRRYLSSCSPSAAPDRSPPAARDEYTFRPIGTFSSPFPELAGCPRQGMLAPATRGTVRFAAHTVPHEALRGLEQYTHVWLVGAFHANANMRYRPVVQPPLLDGARTGVFSTRSPHRPNNISLSLARIDRVDREAAELHVLGVDLVDGTPILDVKPFVRADVAHEAAWPKWLDRPPMDAVEWDERALARLAELAGTLRMYAGADEARRAIDDVLRLDVRTAHVRRKHAMPVYGVCVDTLNVVFTVDDERRAVRVTEVEPWQPPAPARSPAEASDRSGSADDDS
eukprot:m51a1_g9357 hypothetical protein (334) ;mRNA; f:146788-147789